MAKTVIKEIIIMLLLCLAIILLLGIVLYEYVPMTKTIPNPVSYTTPSSVKKELADTEGVDESQIIMTYEVNSNDLDNFKDIQNYKPGKANPFSSYEKVGTNGTTTTTANSSTSSSDTTSSETTTSTGVNSTTSSTENTETVPVETPQNTNTDNQSSQTITNEETTTSGGHFFQDKGTK